MARKETAAHTLTVGERGRVVIPAELRKSLGIAAGDQLVVRVEDGDRLVMEDRRAAVRRLRGLYAGVAPGRDLAAELLEERRVEALVEEAEISGDPGAARAASAELARVQRRHRGNG